MKIDGIYSWHPNAPVPDGYGGPGSVIASIELSYSDLQTLIEDYDVAFMHHKQRQPTKKQKSAGAKDIPDLIMLAIDEKGGRFRQR